MRVPCMTVRAHRPVHWRLAVVAGASAFLVACGGGGGSGDSPLALKTLSNRADLVSGGDAMVEVTLDPDTPMSSLKVTVGNRDVTSAFRPVGAGRVVGVVTGLAEGPNNVTATVDGGSTWSQTQSTLVVTNAPRHGPVLSGAKHITPFHCATPTAQPAVGDKPATLPSGLSGEPDANCNIATETQLYYRTTAASTGAGACSLNIPDPSGTPPANPCFKPYIMGSTPPDLATTTTDHGETVPFIVRRERGTMNRGIYDIAVLWNPAQPWNAVAPQSQWNGKVFYSFGSSTGQPRRQSRPTATNWSNNEEQLKRGWLVVSNSMTDSVRNSNRVMMSETVMMMKEHISDTYGLVRYTLGTGCSGGSINANMNLSIFPGLLDGIVTSCTYPDSETTTLEVSDCVLLAEAYQKPAMLDLWGTLGLDQAQINARKGAINGHPDQTACHAWYNAFGSNAKPGVYNQRVVADNTTGAIATLPTPTNNCELPNSAVFDPANAAATANLPRCDAWSWAENIWGRNPGAAAPRDTRDNVGVQYGLRALLAGAITAEEFVTLNEAVGGTDGNTQFTARRSEADPQALATAYRSGIVASGRNLAKAPIIDLRGWDDSNVPANVPPGLAPGQIPIHHQWYSFGIRDRIARDVGDAGNQALWRFARTGLAAPGTVGLEAFNVMDQWLAALKADASGGPLEARVRATRPASARDFCIPPSDAAQATRIYDMAACDADPFLKPSLSPRQVAGGPRSEDVLKCQLKPLAAADYAGVSFSADQWSRLQAVFSTGVCDWSRPGVGQQAAVAPLDFRAGPGGVPLGEAPMSSRP